MNLRSLALRRVLLGSLCAIFVPVAHGQTVTWTGLGGDDEWGNPNNWISINGGGEPLSFEDAVIPAGFTVNLDNSLPYSSVESLSVTDSTFTQFAGAPFYVNADVTNTGSAAGLDSFAIQDNFTTDGDFYNQGYGTVTVAGAQLSLQSFGTTTGTFINSDSAVLNLNDGSGVQGGISYIATSFLNENNAVVNIVGGMINSAPEITENITNSGNAQMYVAEDAATKIKSLVQCLTFTNMDKGYVELDTGSTLFAAYGFQNQDNAILKIQAGSLNTGLSGQPTTGLFENASRASVYVSGSGDAFGSLAANSIENDGYMELDFNGYVEDRGGFLNSSTGTLIGYTGDSLGANSLTNQGTVNLSGGLYNITDALINSGTGSFTIQNSASSLPTTFLSAGSLLNEGNATITVNDVAGVASSTFYTDVTGPITNQDNASITLNGSTMDNFLDSGGGSFVNEGNAQISVLQDETSGFQSDMELEGFSFTNQGNAIVTVTGSTLDVGDSSPNSGSFQILGNAQVIVQADSVTGAGSTLEVGTLGFSNQNSAQLSVIGSTLTTTGDLENHNNASIAIVGGTVNTVGGVLNTDSASISVTGLASSFNASSITGNVTNQNNATFAVSDVTGASSLAVTGGLLNEGSATFTVTGSGLSVSGTAVNQDNAKLEALSDTSSGSTSSVTISGGVQNLGSGYVEVGAGSSLSAPTYFQTGVGAVTKNYGTMTTNVTLGNVGDAPGSAGHLGGSGTIIGATHNNAGIIAPGDPQVLTMIGSYTQGANGEVVFDVDGSGGPGVGFDQLDVKGNVNLGGTLDIVLGNGYTLNGVLPLLVYSGTLTGGFSAVDINGAPTSLYGNGLGFTQFVPPTPEPSSLLALALPILGLLRRRALKR